MDFRSDNNADSEDPATREIRKERGKIGIKSIADPQVKLGIF